MKRILPFWFCAIALSGANPVPLPRWDEAERKKLAEEGWIAGAALLGEEQPVEGGEQPAGPDMGVAEPTKEETEAENEPSREIPENLWATYFNQRPDGFLVDPQNLLTATEAKNRLAFLRYHANDSSVDLFVYVFHGDQIIPGEVREEELAERFFSHGKPAVIVMYYLGAPQRSRLYLSPSIADAVPVAERQRALESSVMQAFRHVDFPGQFEAFLVQMSIRVYWMERLLKGESVHDNDAAYRLPIASTRRETEAKPGAEKVKTLLAKTEPYRMPALALGSLVLAVIAWRTVSRFRSRFVFPEIEVEPRLGGAHAAGVGAVISFSSRTVSPSSQKEAVPDYLRRM